MSIDTIYEYTRQTPTSISEEEYTDVGTSFTLGTNKRAFLASGFALRRTSGGTPLTLDVDYELDEKDAFYSQAAYENEDVYTKVNILNATYETGDLYVTYSAVLTYATKSAVQAFAIQSGFIMPYAGTSAPSGWLACDGSAVSRTTYANLFTAIGVTWGVGDGSTTFNIPDLRGAFLRGAGAHGTETDAGGTAFTGPAVGAYQDDQMQGFGFWGTDSDTTGNSVGIASDIWSWNGFSGIRNNTVLATQGYYTQDGAGNDLIGDNGTDGSPRTGNETNPFGAGVYYCIKI